MFEQDEILYNQKLEIRELFDTIGITNSKKRKAAIIELLQINNEEYLKRLHARTIIDKLINQTNAFKTKNGHLPKRDFNYKDIIAKFGEKPVCYLTGRSLTWEKVSFDHIIPSSKGGSNELDNLNLVEGWVNALKLDYDIDTFKKRIIDLAEDLKKHEIRLF